MIFNENLSSLTKEMKRLSLRKPRENISEGTEKATCLEFGVMSLENEGIHKSIPPHRPALSNYRL